MKSIKLLCVVLAGGGKPSKTLRTAFLFAQSVPHGSIGKGLLGNETPMTRQPNLVAPGVAAQAKLCRTWVCLFEAIRYCLRTGTCNPDVILVGWPRSIVTIQSLCLGAVLFFGHDVFAITIRHDRPVEAYNDLAAQFPAAGYIASTDFGQDCSATLVSPFKALTVSHCLDFDVDGLIDNPIGTLSFGTESNVPLNLQANVAAFYLHPQWVSSGGDQQFDVAIIELTSPIVGITPAQFSARDPRGLLGTMVGYGEQGTGLNPDDGIPGATDRLATHNMIDEWDTMVHADFDHPNGTTSSLGSNLPVDLEGAVYFGDSGGPLFAEYDDGTYIVGVASRVYNPFGDIAAYGGVSLWTALGTDSNVAFLAEHDIFPETAPSTILAELSAIYTIDDDDSDGVFDNLGDKVVDHLTRARTQVGEDDRSRNRMRRLVAKFALPDVPVDAPVLERAMLWFSLQDILGMPAGPLSLLHSITDNDLDKLASDFENPSYVDTLLDMVQPTDPGGQYYKLDVTDLVLADYAADGLDPLSAFRLEVSEAVFFEDDSGRNSYRLHMPALVAKSPQLVLTFTAVPEPSTLTLATLTLLGLLAHGHRRRRA